MEVCGLFKEARERLDYSYHVNYTPERQAWQDIVVASVRRREGPRGAWSWVLRAFECVSSCALRMRVRF